MVLRPPVLATGGSFADAIPGRFFPELLAAEKHPAELWSGASLRPFCESFVFKGEAAEHSPDPSAIQSCGTWVGV
jgi:hypothetical protein